MTAATAKFLYVRNPALCCFLILTGAVVLFIWARIHKWHQRARMAARSRMKDVRHVLQMCRRRPRSWNRIAEAVAVMLYNSWPLNATVFSALLTVHCVMLGIERLHTYRNGPRNLQLWTYQETHFDLTSMGPSLVSPVHDPRSLSPYGPRSDRTLAHFCGRPTASSYDGYTGAPHAAYMHHDVERDRYVVRTFGRGGMRVDERRRSGVGRSTYEAFCAAPRSVQRGTPLA
ncbi:hypothetical predicted transmembrane protein, partial [Leishmania donovani]